MLSIVKTTAFKKDFKRILKQGKDPTLIKNIIFDLKEEKDLDKKYKDHNLICNYKDKRECHILSDWLLIYEINGNELVLHRTGSHSELFR